MKILFEKKHNDDLWFKKGIKFGKSAKKILSVILIFNVLFSMFCVSVASEEESAELLYDPGMENLDGWGFFQSDKTLTTFDTNEKRSGESSLHTKVGAWVMSNKVDINSESYYSFSIWVKGSGRFLIGIPCFDSEDNELKTYWGETSGYGTTMFDSGKNVVYASWTQLKLSLSKKLIPDNCAKLRISIRALDDADLYFDDASLKAYPASVIDENYSENLITDPTMGAYSFWKWNASVTPDYEVYHSEGVSAKIAHTSNQYDYLDEGTYHNNYMMEENKIYEMSVWLKTDTCTDCPIQMILIAKEGNNEVVTVMGTANPTKEWQQHKFYIYVPDRGFTITDGKTARMKVRIAANKGATAGNIWVDDVTLRLANLDIDLQNNMLKASNIQKIITDGGALENMWYASGEGKSGIDRTVNHWNFYNAENVNQSIRLGTGSLMAENENGFVIAGGGYGVALDESKEYELTFWAKASKENAGAVNFILNTNSLYESAKSYPFYPTSEWKQYKYLIDMSKLKKYETFNTDGKLRPRFEVWNGFDGYAYIDDVTLCEVSYGYTNADGSINMEAPIIAASAGQRAVSIKAYFNTENGNADVVVAVYSKGCLKDCVLITDRTTSVGYNKYDIELHHTLETGDTIKAFIFDEINNLIPLKLNGTKSI